VVYSGVRKIPRYPETKELIKKLFRMGITKPKAIIDVLAKMMLKCAKIGNFYALNTKIKFIFLRN
jgi:hypothetical protein